METTELTDDCPMPWGQHKGKSMIDVPADYLLQMYGSGKCCAIVKAYIEDNKDVLEKEIPKPRMKNEIYY